MAENEGIIETFSITFPTHAEKQNGSLLDGGKSAIKQYDKSNTNIDNTVTQINMLMILMNEKHVS